MTPSSHSHEAAHSALGYLYQSQWPLLELVRRSPAEPDCAVTLELFDDVSWDADGHPSELLQVKHHVNLQRQLGDKDVDLWKTIASWMDAHPAADPAGPTLTLVTTQIAAANSAAAALRPGDDRDPIAAAALLSTAARASTAQATNDVRDRFLALNDSERAVFVSRMYVLDGEPQIGADLDDELRRALYLVLPTGHEQSFLDLLVAWWQRIAVALLRRQRGTVSALELKARIDDLRNRFAGDNLPTLVDRDDVNFDVEQTYANRPFVEQLRWIALTAKLLQHAMIDYYRAYTQSALWLEDNLVALDELRVYEAELKDEWERQFEFMTLKLPPGADEATQQQAGQELLRQVSDNSNVRVRAYSESFFSRGKLHELADAGRVGWHPDFEACMQSLLMGGTT